MRRRAFLECAAGATAALSIPAARILGANERIRIGWIGCGGRGRHIARLLRDEAKVEIAAVCDVFETNRLAAQSWAGPACDAFKDFRDLLAGKDIDAVLIATPDHWHAIPAVLACEAGKDVYVEKPLAHNIAEGRAMVQAARRHKRIVQVGLQQRSAPHIEAARRIVASGELGRIHYIRIWNFRNIYPRGIGRAPDGDPPAGLDWEFYCGPAPLVPFNPNRFLWKFRFFWDYAGGIITDYGTHRFDTLHQVMGADAPSSVSASGGRFAIDDGTDVPDLLQVTYAYPGLVVSYEACALNAHGTGGRTPGRRYYGATGSEDRPNGLAFYGTNGTLMLDRIGFQIHPERVAEGQEMTAEDATPLHVRNFIECVRTRRQPAADIEIGHRSTIIAHLGNIAFRTGRKVRWDAAKEEIIDDPDASRWLRRRARPPWDIL